MRNSTMLRILISIVVILPSFAEVSAGGVFGEVAAAIGGTYPQGSFARYGDPGVFFNIRGTVHLPAMEFFVGWLGISYASFSDETFETSRLLYELENGVKIYRPVDETVSEDMVAGHIGLQIANPTRHAFFRPRIAAGIGFYHFTNTISWTEQDGDSTVTLASDVLDSQNSFGWRIRLGSDFFITERFGITSDLIYDHVFDLNQNIGPGRSEDMTSRFNGFSVGVVYMFSTD